MQYYKDLIFNFFNLFGIYEIALMGFLFIIFLIFFLLGLLLAGRKIVPQLMFFFTTAIFISAPFALQMAMQRFLYTIEVNITESKRLAYIDAFFLQGSITNVGFAPFSVCESSVSVLREGILAFFNPIFPAEKYSKTIKMPLKPGESGEFSVVLDDFSAQLPFKYSINIDCHNVSGLIKFGLDKDSLVDEGLTEELLTHKPNDEQESAIDSNDRQNEIKESELDKQPSQENEPNDTAINNTDDTKPQDLQNQETPTPQDVSNSSIQSQSESKDDELKSSNLDTNTTKDISESNTQTNTQNPAQEN